MDEDKRGCAQFEGAADDWARLEYSYYVMRGNGLDERVVMAAIARAKRRFFLRPTYLLRHSGDVAKLAKLHPEALVEPTQTLDRPVVVDWIVMAAAAKGLSAVGGETSDSTA